MKLPHLFLSSISKDQKDFINLLETTAKVHGEVRPNKSPDESPLWGEDFYHLGESDLWHSFSNEIKKQILISLGQKILQEAYFIECAGMAYAAKMNLAAKTKEERAFFCFVGEEEAMHLRLIESLANFSISLDSIPSFALLIGEIIQEVNRPSHLLLIQILLEGWGLHYYKTLAKSTHDENVAQALKTILKDEIRHHSAGVMLFNIQKTHGLPEEDIAQFLNYLERIAFMVKVGPWTVCEAVMKHAPHTSQGDLQDFLKQIHAVEVTVSKMEILHQLIEKSLPSEVMDMVRKKNILSSLDEQEMTKILSESIL